MRKSLKVNPTGFAVELDVKSEREESSTAPKFTNTGHCECSVNNQMGRFFFFLRQKPGAWF